jgi:hypothetical protein
VLKKKKKKRIKSRWTPTPKGDGDDFKINPRQLSDQPTLKFEMNK